MNTKFLLLFWMVTFCGLASAGIKSYTYIDGNNNEFTITTDSLIYFPITPAESSSGEYSGGEPKRVKISSEQFLKIESIIKSIQKDKSIRLDTRLMGCGTLVIEKKAMYLSSDSKLKEDLENELKSCLH